ncbi:MAG TPA: phenylalanine--tRNA ligase subunit beta [Acidimicrobiales bacterium]|nr:phenylalanine--tRNA ligase subunit beta [Acidimicrobiales bacterium]
MRVPLSWLRDFAPFEGDPVALGETFDDLGMVVEGRDRVGEGLDGVVVARVLDVRPHPKADRVRLTEVDAGDGRPRQVVCGAPNVAAGQLVALATIGAVLPGDFEISRRQVRGEWSEGMICSARELGLGEDADGIMVLPAGLEPGTAFAEAMGIASDVVYDLAIEANRPDALSIAGIARDAAARLGLPFAIPDHPVAEVAQRVEDLATIAVECPDLCPRFTASVMTGVKVGESPAWLVRRLALAGMRAISDVVDASNYVMLELGQPTHPYDLDLLPGAGLLVRRAEPGETLVTLDGVTRRLGDGDDCLICDAKGVPVGIGGIMGGASSEISSSTTRVLLEAAYFDRMTIARTSKRLGLRSEASARFERGCDPEGIERAVNRVFSLLTGGGGAKDARLGSDTISASTTPGGAEVATGMLDLWSRPPPAPPIRLRTKRVNALLGAAITDDEIRSLLEPIGFRASPAGAGLHDVVVPSFRPDVEAEIDLVEEVARHHGYSRITPTVPASPYVGQLTPYQRGRRHLHEILAGAGVSEAVTPPLVGPGDHERVGLAPDTISAVDPLAREESILRTSLLPGLLKAIAFNASHRSPDVALFEIGHVFRPPMGRRGPLPDEPEMLMVALADPEGGPDSGAVAAKRLLDLMLDALHLPGARLDAATSPGLHPSRTARIQMRGDVIGHVGEVDPDVLEAMGIAGRVGLIEVLLDGLVPQQRSYVQSRPVSRHPSSDIDLAFVASDTTPAAAIAVTLREAAGDLLTDLRLFDVFRDARLGAGRRSLAFRLRLQALDRTLTDTEVTDLRRRCINAVAAAHAAEIRA